MNKKQTSKSVATKASQILRDGRYCSKAKSVAGSALAQTKTGKKKQLFPNRQRRILTDQPACSLWGKQQNTLRQDFSIATEIN